MLRTLLAQVAGHTHVRTHRTAEPFMPSNAFRLEPVRVGDIEKILRDVSEGLLAAKVRQTLVGFGMWWASSGQSYLLSIDHGGEVEGAGLHYLLFHDGRAFEACTSLGTNGVRLVGFGSSDEHLRDRIEAEFISALRVFGRYGRGQDGHFNTQPGHPDEVVHSIDPVFEAGTR